MESRTKQYKWPDRDRYECASIYRRIFENGAIHNLFDVCKPIRRTNNER